MKNYPNLQVYIIYKTNQKMENTNKHPEIQAAEIVAEAINDLHYSIEANGPHGNNPTTGANLLDGIFEVAFQLKRIADALEKK